MNKLTRRILALTLTVCTLLSVMAPTVFADGTTPEAKTYDFSLGTVRDAVANNTTNTLTIADNVTSAAFGTAPYKTGIIPAITEAYGRTDGTGLDWMIGDNHQALLNNNNTLLTNTNYTGLRFHFLPNDVDYATSGVNDRVGVWVSFPIKAPNPGTYSFVLNHGTSGKDGMAKVGVYMISYTGDTAPDKAAIQALLDDTTAAGISTLGDYTCDNAGTSESTKITASSLDNTYKFEAGTNYILVLKALEDRDDSTIDSKIYISSLALTPVIEIPELDPVDTYNFNYADLSDTVKADLTASDSNYKFTTTTHTTIATEFDAVQRYWKIGENYNVALNSNTQFMSSLGLRIRMNPNTTDPVQANSRDKTWVSFPIASPASGEKALIIDHGTRGGAGGMEEVGVYMISYTGDTAPTYDEIQSQLTKGSSAYVGSYSCDSAAAGESETTTATPLDNTYTFSSDAKYILVLKAEVAQETNSSETDYGTNDVYIYINQLSLVDPVVSVGSSNYGSVSAALAAAGNGSTVTLNGSTSDDTVEIPTGVTLNLNGNTLTVGNFSTVTGGKIVDTSNGSGLIACAKKNGSFGSDNGSYLPMYDNTAEGYRLYAYATKKAVQGSGSAAKFWFDVDFTNDDAYDLLGNNLTLSGNVSWAGTASGSLEGLSFDQKVIKNMASQQLTYPEKDLALYLNVMGIDALAANDTLTATFIAEANGVEIAFDITYTVVE